jgi:hypothetical protein
LGSPPPQPPLTGAGVQPGSKQAAGRPATGQP